MFGTPMGITASFSGFAPRLRYIFFKKLEKAIILVALLNLKDVSCMSKIKQSICSILSMIFTIERGTCFILIKKSRAKEALLITIGKAFPVSFTGNIWI